MPCTQAVMTGCDAAQELERQGLATKTAIATSLVDLPTGNRTCLEVTLTKTPDFASKCQQVAEELVVGEKAVDENGAAAFAVGAITA